MPYINNILYDIYDQWVLMCEVWYHDINDIWRVLTYHVYINLCDNDYELWFMTMVCHSVLVWYDMVLYCAPSHYLTTRLDISQ